MDLWLIILIIILIGVAVIIYAIWFNKRLNTDRVEEKQSMRSERRRAVKAAAVNTFIEPKVLGFYQALVKALPSNYVVFPNVSAELLFQKNQRPDLRLWGTYADMTIFSRDFEPILVIDLVDHSLRGDVVHPLSDEIRDIIKMAGINVLQYAIQDNYSIDDLRKAVAKAMNPLYTQ